MVRWIIPEDSPTTVEATGWGVRVGLVSKFAARRIRPVSCEFVRGPRNPRGLPMNATAEATRWVRPREAAELACVSLQTIKRWVASGVIRSSKPARLLLVDRASLMAHLDRCASGGVNPSE